MYKLLLLLLSVLTGFAVHAQQQQFFEIFTEKDGLTDNRVTCFLKDKTGFLWVGTKNGLNRYNGYNFTHFLPIGNTVANEQVNDLAEDKTGNIWVSTMSGLSRFNSVTKKWKSYYALGVDTPAMLLNPIVWDSYLDEENKLWIATDFQGVSFFDNTTQTFTHYPWKKIVRQLLPQYKNSYFSVLKIIPKSNDELWLGTTMGLFLFNKRTGSYELMGRGYNAYAINMLYASAAQKVFISITGNRLFCYNEVTKQFTEVQVKEIPFPSTMLSIASGNYQWMGAADGLLLINPQASEVYLQKHIPPISVSLPEGGIRNVYDDGAGITWLASDNGIVKYDRNNQFSSFLPLLNISDRAGSNRLSGLMYDEVSGCYFVCAPYKGSVFIISKNDNSILELSKDAAGNKFANCVNITKDRTGTIWLLTDEQVYQYNNFKKAFVKFPMPAGTGGYRDMLQDTDGNYWFSGFTGNLSFYKTAEKKFTVPGDSTNFYSIIKSNPLFLDTVHQCVWIGTFSHGVYQYHLPSKKFTLFTETKESKNYTPLNLTHDITQDGLGNIWVATHSGGLFKYTHGKPYADAFTQLSMEQGLSSNNIYSVKAIDSGLWVLSGNHLFAVNVYTNKVSKPVAGKQVFSYTAFGSDDYYPQRIGYDRQQNLMLAAAGGGIVFFRNKKQTGKEQFPLVLNAVAVNDSLLPDHLVKQPMQVFQSPVRNITINFSALQYSLSPFVQYEYRLLGYDQEWKKASNINHVQYQNLKAGTYRFQLKAKSPNDVYAVNEISYSFKVAPFFWQTWWFVLLCVAATAAAVYSLYRYQLRKKIEVERLRHRISRDLHDDVGSALTTINVLSKVAINKSGEDADVRDYLKRIKTSSEQTMESMSDIVWAINPMNDSLDSMLVRMKEYASELCEAAGIKLEFDVQETLLQRKLDVDARKNVFLIFKEAVNNAVKYSRCTILKVSLHGNGGIELQVNDDGIGFLEHRKNGGNGLKNMDARAKALNGKLLIQSKTNSGTQITLMLPFP